MFFVAKEKIGTTLGSQKEYTAATRRGIGFSSHGNVWHYLWPIDMLEPSLRQQIDPQQPQPGTNVPDADAEFENEHQQNRIGAPTHVLWSQEVGPGEVIGEPVITAYSGAGNWIDEAKRKFTEAQAARASAQ